MVDPSEVAAIDRHPEMVVILDGTNDVGPGWPNAETVGTGIPATMSPTGGDKAEANAIQPLMATHQCFARVSRFDFGGQLREQGQIAVEFLRQTTEDCLGRDHLAIDHPKQLYRVHAQLRTELEYIRTPGHAKVSDVGAEPVWFRGHRHGNQYVVGLKQYSASRCGSLQAAASDVKQNR